MRSRSLAGLAATTLAAVLSLTGCSGSDSDSQSAEDPAPTTASAPSTPAASDAAGPCTYTVDGSTPAKQAEPPSSTPTRTGKVAVTIDTSFGAVGATLDADATPCTVNSFLSLAEQGYFDDTPCHRLTAAPASISVLQCGDPSGTGMGGPGYAFDDEVTGSETYPAGTLAMANAGPNTNGSQFFVVYADSVLAPDYTVFGQLDAAGLKAVQELGELGTATGESDGPPAEKVTITSVTADD